MRTNYSYNAIDLREFLKIERRHATRKFSSALFCVLLGFIGLLYRCITCIGKILLKILLIVLVRFCAVCFRHPRSAFLRSAVCDLCFRGLCFHFWRRPLSFRCYVSDGKTSSRSFFKSVISFRNWVKCPRQKQKQGWNKKLSFAERPLLTA